MEAGYCPCRGRRGVPRRDVRSRARAGPRSGRRREARSATRSLDGEKSAKPPLRHRRSAGVACATVRGARGRGIERALSVLETTIPRASSVSRETSSAACEVRTAITRNSTRPPRALDVTTFFVDEARRLLLRAFWVEPCAETPNVHVSPRRESPKIGGDIPYAHLVTRARKDAKRTRVDRCAFR